MLQDKIILLISPQPWGKLFVSKHHYAVELVKRGNKVIFLSPPDYTLEEQFHTYEVQEGLIELKYRPFFKTSLRFKFRWLYDMLMQVQVKQLMSKIGEKVDIVWCFDPNLYTNLKWFGASYAIYHPVDPIVYPYQIKPAASANIVLSVSHKILSAFSSVTPPSFFINHGLSHSFAQQAAEKIKNLDDIVTPTQSQSVKVGYVGNLLRQEMDRELLLQLIKSNKLLEFHLWGPYSLEGSNLAGSKDQATASFVNSLKEMTNVKLYGGVPATEIPSLIGDIDVFILLYDLAHGTSDRSNSHKILEYLSTGKVVISYSIEAYAGKCELIAVPHRDDRVEYERLLNEVISNLSHWNSSILQKERLLLALDNTYHKQISSISELIHDNTYES